MKLLLTSGGITNASIRRALVDLLGKPIAACNALCIPTAQYGHPMCTPASAWRFVSGKSPSPMSDLGWKSLGLLELTALPSIDEARWVSWIREADVFLVDGGEEFVPRLFAELGVSIKSVSVSRPTLDDVFMSYTGSTIRDAEESYAKHANKIMMQMMSGGRR